MGSMLGSWRRPETKTKKVDLQTRAGVIGVSWQEAIIVAERAETHSFGAVSFFIWLEMETDAHTRTYADVNSGDEFRAQLFLLIVSRLVQFEKLSRFTNSIYVLSGRFFHPLQ